MAILKRNITVRLHDTDAAGILFFARQFYFAHDIYEELLAQIGMPMSELINHPDFFVPIVHAESQFLKPLTAGQQIEISVRIAEIGNTSYTLEYRLRDFSGDEVGRAETVHVSVSRATKTKTPLPDQIRSKLSAFQNAP